MPRLAAVLASLLVAAVAAGCRGSAAGDGRRAVVAAFYPLAFAAERVSRGRADVHDLTPPGAEPHDVELTPRDVAEVQDADVVLYVSQGFQPAVEHALEGARGKAVDVLDGIRLRHTEHGSDPHVWLDPVLFARVARRIGAALDERAGAGTLATRLRVLDRQYRRGLARCMRRDFVTSHAAFGYLAARYRLRQVAIGGLDPEAEPGAQTLRDLARLVRDERAPVVFVEKLVSPKVAETVAREAGVRTAVLDPIEGLTAAERDRGDDYFTLMHRNLAALREALGCR